jgi:ABC-type glycerol-3-phosphate transport system permease component
VCRAWTVGAWLDRGVQTIVGPRVETGDQARGLAYFTAAPEQSRMRFGQWQLYMAAATFSMLPTLVVFLAAQRYFVRGVVMSGLKG